MSVPFEWDESKAIRNRRIHGLDFPWAQRVFDDPYAVDRIDDRSDYGEERSVIIGGVDNEIVSLVYTEREDHIRIISARRATKAEKNDYFQRKK